MSTAVRAISRDEASPAESLFLLIVDADRWVRDLSREVAAGMGFKVYTAENTRAALRQMEVQPVDVVLLDVRQSTQDGIDLLAKFKETHPQTEIIIVSGHATVDSVVNAMKSGACDFIRKPFKGEELKSLLTRTAARLRNSLEDRIAREHLQASPGDNGMLAHSPEMQKLYRIITKVAASNHPVLVHGESGTGKETAARAIHANGPYRDHPFLLVDCAATGAAALENELFGSIKSVNGSAKSRDGLFTLASGGTVFFDEIGEMPLDIQGKLIRVLQEREFHVQGNIKSIPLDVRMIAGSSRDLEMAVQQGTFRRDLFFRLNVVSLRLPPLRERKEDIRPLAEHLLERVNQARHAQYSIDPEAVKLLQFYDWPGNVRELENCLERAVAMSTAPTLQPIDFPPHIRTAALRTAVPGKQARILPLAELEKQAILDALQQLNGDKLMTARALGIGKTTLYRKLKEYGIPPWISSPMPVPVGLK
ncbi:MAG: two component, sigma54 specific, transcriptional regulator, Fis family [Candidatus Angelobacter sp.]|nr:two component, sigma54 specific, transcriptional regulator, Fis family [Candidatus Angelobacter sp.]